MAFFENKAKFFITCVSLVNHASLKHQPYQIQSNALCPGKDLLITKVKEKKPLVQKLVQTCISKSVQGPLREEKGYGSLTASTLTLIRVWIWKGKQQL